MVSVPFPSGSGKAGLNVRLSLSRMGSEHEAEDQPRLVFTEIARLLADYPESQRVIEMQGARIRGSDGESDFPQSYSADLVEERLQQHTSDPSSSMTSVDNGGEDPRNRSVFVRRRDRVPDDHPVLLGHPGQ